MARRKKPSGPTCQWKMNDPYEGDFYGTSCGEAFTLIDGTPTENKMRFCPYCGRRIQERAAAEEE